GSAPQGASGDVQGTLQGGGSARLGRWETRGSTTQRSTSGRSYRIRYELVPASQAGQRCASSGIVIAETTGPGGDLTYGVRGPRGGSWARTTTLSSTVGASSFAVQVTKRHITWFLNGSPIGTVRDRAMIPRQRMTVRISMLDVDGSPMKSAKSTVDWVRSYTLKYGKRPTSKKALRKGAAVGGC
ncbi:MAG: hypothetical protein ACI379_00140, partial [Nocardioides sp.]|uniref:hypothetical protein n=1 Tax=Nocardioides sp. TaxID=35761 RepID=UPI003F00AC1B